MTKIELTKIGFEKDWNGTWFATSKDGNDIIYIPATDTFYFEGNEIFLWDVMDIIDKEVS